MLYCVKGLESGDELTEVVGMDISTGGAIIGVLRQMGGGFSSCVRPCRVSTEGWTVDVVLEGRRCDGVCPCLPVCLRVTEGVQSCRGTLEALGLLTAAVATARLPIPASEQWSGDNLVAQASFQEIKRNKRRLDAHVAAAKGSFVGRGVECGNAVLFLSSPVSSCKGLQGRCKVGEDSQSWMELVMRCRLRSPSPQ